MRDAIPRAKPTKRYTREAAKIIARVAADKELRDLNKAMVKFLKGLIVVSDKQWGGNRSPDTERRYQQAKRLIVRAEKLK